MHKMLLLYRDIFTFIMHLLQNSPDNRDMKTLCDTMSTMAQMAHFSFPYYFTIPNSEFRILNSEICTANFGIRNFEVLVIWAGGQR